jgi:hypothetical protein
MFLQLNDRKIIKEEDLQQFQQCIIKGIEQMCVVNPRCKPLKASWYKPETTDWLLSGLGFTNFHLYASK